MVKLARTFLTVVLAMAFPLAVMASGQGPVLHDDQDVDGLWRNVKDSKEVKRVEPDEDNLKAHEDLIKEYAKYWKAISDKNHKTAYGFELSSYREKMTFYSYKKDATDDHAIIVKGVDPIKATKMNAKEVKVRGFIRYVAAGGMIDSIRTFNDFWILEDGVWKHDMEAYSFAVGTSATKRVQ